MAHDLYLGDCLEGMKALPDKSVGHVICDPPYEAEAHTLQRRVKRPGGSGLDGGTYNGNAAETRMEALSFAPMDELERVAVAAEIARVVRRWVVVFCQVEAAVKWEQALVEAGLVKRRIGVWIKPDGMPQYTGDRPGMGYESLVMCHAAGRSRWNAGGKHGVYVENKIGPADVDRSGHPTQKPVALMEALVSDFTDPGELVCDPFAGSGTTAVACKRLGRSFIGWERGWATLTEEERRTMPEHAQRVLLDIRNEALVARVRARIEAAREQFQLPRMPKPKQARLLP